MNPFTNILNHFAFVVVIVIEIAVQQSMIMTGSENLNIYSALLSTGHLSTVEHIVTYVIALLVIPVGIAAKKIPSDAFKWTEAINLEDPDYDDGVNKWFNKIDDGVSVARRSIANPQDLAYMKEGIEGTPEESDDDSAQ